MKWCIICLLPLIALALASRQYHYVAGPKTWTEAQTYCRENYNDLSTISDKEEMQILNELSLNLSISGGVWIGLYNKLETWGSDFDHLADDRDRCIYLRPQNSWTSCPCHLQLAFACRNVNQYGFNINWNYKKSWTEAQRECQQNHTRLATLRNKEEKDYLKSIMPVGVIGLHMDPYGDGWTWSDDSTPFFVNWLNCTLKLLNSSKRCVASLQNPGSQGRWETQSCTERLPFFCMSTNTSTPKPQVPVKRRQIVRVELQVNSSVELNTYEFQEVILSQIKAKLGLPEGAILSWRKHPDGQIFHKKNEKRDKEEGRSKVEF